MKKLVGSVLVLGTLIAPSVARAEAKGAKLDLWMTYRTIEECAASLSVTASEGGLTDGTETLKLGASLSYSFADGGFSPPAGEFGVGKSVLYASPAFEAATGAKADISIPNADCAAFNASGGALKFDGSLGRNPNIVDVNIPASFGTNRAIDGWLAPSDLTQRQVTFKGFTGEWTIGTAGGMGGGLGNGTGGGNGDGTGGGNGGGTGQPAASDGSSDSCSTTGASASPPSFVFVLAAGILSTMLRRRRPSANA